MFFEDIEEDCIIHAIRGIELDILRDSQGIVFSVEELKSSTWELTFGMTKKGAKIVVDNMLSNVNIQHYYIATRC